MSAPLPVLLGGGDLAVVDPDTGEALTLRDAPDRALAHAAARVAAADRELLNARRALAAELRDRHGVGATCAGGYRFTIAEAASWPAGATKNALDQLVQTGQISLADAERAMPSRPRPDVRALKALQGRLMVSDPDAARVLAQACTVSPPSVRDLQVEAIDSREAAA